MKYRWRTTPYRHQIAAVKKLLDNGYGGALLAEPRTGKTKIVIDYACILHKAGKVNRVLVICPVSVLDVWVSEIRIHCATRFRITIWDNVGRKWINLPRYGQDVLDFVLVNYDAFSTPGQMVGRRADGSIKRARRGGRFEVRDRLRLWQPQLMVLDESHRIKSPSARRTTTILSVAWRQRRASDGSFYKEELVPYRVLATGTAVTKKKRIFDLYTQWKFLNPELELVQGHTAASFKREYGVWISRNGYDQWLKERNSSTLHRLVHRDAFSVAREECFDLPEAYPPKLVHIPLEESARIYDEMAEEMVARIKSGEITEASIKLVQQLRLRQITSGLAKTAPSAQYPNGRLVRIGREKLRVIEDLVTDWFDQEEKIVICASFRGDILSMAKLMRTKFKRVPVFTLMGGDKRVDRTKAIADFKAVTSPACFIMNPQAGSLGIDLRSASTMVWYSLTNSYVDYVQAMDRIALSGKANRFYYLLAKDTYDELQYEALQQDGDVVKAIMASPERLLRNFKD